jgi:hypothetical protein
MAYIYRLHDKKSRKIKYIGQTVQTLEQKIKTYLGSTNHHWFKNIGYVSFSSVEDNKEIINIYEEYYIKYYHQKGYKLINKNKCDWEEMKLPDGLAKLNFSRRYRVDEIVSDASRCKNYDEPLEDTFDCIDELIFNRINEFDIILDKRKAELVSEIDFLKEEVRNLKFIISNYFETIESNQENIRKKMVNISEIFQKSNFDELLKLIYNISNGNQLNQLSI